jgi:hypothetical protein
MHQKYEVETEGNTMTMREVSGSPNIMIGEMDSTGRLVRVEFIEVFDKSPRPGAK